MPKYLSEVKTDISRRMITMEVFQNDTVFNGMSVEVCLMDVDRYAREFSKLVHASGGRVRLMEDARIRAVYENGHRIQQSDMRDFYGMSDEEYAESRILCVLNHVHF